MLLLIMQNLLHGLLLVINKFNNGIIIQTYKNNWGTQDGVTIASGKSQSKSLNWPLSWPHYTTVSYVGILNQGGVVMSTSSVTASNVTFNMFNATSSSKTIDRCNIIAIGY